MLVDTPQFLVTARPGDRMLTVMSKRLGAAAAVEVEPRLDAVINALMIDVFQLGYSDVVAFLDRARQQEAMNAPLVLEPLIREEFVRTPLPGATSPESTAPAIVPGMRQPQPPQQP